MSLEERIKILETKEAIRELKARYFHACDRKNVEVIRECFNTGEIQIDYGVIGVFNNRDKFINVFVEKACHDHIVDLHHGQNAQFDEVTDSLVKARWDLYFYQVDSQRNTLTQLGGYYEDVFTNTSGEWKIQSTRFNVCSSYVAQINEHELNVLFAGAPPS